MVSDCPLGGATFDAHISATFIVALHCLHLERNAGLRRDRRMVYALCHNPQSSQGYSVHRSKVGLI